jgi:hypothetical protein
VAATRVEAWRVHDTGLVAVPTRFRRLGGLVRHLQGHGEPWPDRVVLDLDGDALRVTSLDGTTIGSWPGAAATAERVGGGPPVSFVLTVPGASHLLAAAASPETDALLAALARAPGDGS